MPNHLVIVESKAKAETIGKYLGSDYTVMASYGHVRDLPEKGLGIDVDNHFAVEWAPPQDRAKKVVADIKRAMKGADTLYLATDEDREGESIAWHLLELLQPKGVEVHRMVFHEITEDAIEEALANTRQIDMRLVEAADGRRIMDRLVGYLVSPVLWRRVPSARSAGRVQSPAVRLVVERERARMKFVAAQYCDLAAIMNAATGDDDRSFAARLVEIAGQPIATGKDFDADTGLLLETSKARQLNDAEADALIGALEGALYTVTSADTRPFTEKPKEPFRTSTLQQEAGNKLGFSAGRTMSIAQGLYERGFITYMRTDSANLSEQAITAARIQVAELYGKQFVPAEPRRYKSGRNAQEAHEAIRPSGERFRVPASVRSELSNDEMRLYELIWMRTLASQMENARGNTATLRIGAQAGDEAVVFRASGKTYSFLGFRAAYIDVSEDDPSADGEGAEAEAVLPVLAVGDRVNCSVLEVSPHSTKPPARFTEASLVKELESKGIGRPSTYASIIDKISSTRGYVYKQGNALVPSWTAFAKTQCLETNFANLVDYRFTATMEEVLDKVAAGEAEAEKWLDEFYFGRDTPGLKQLVSQENLDTIKMEVVNSIYIGDDSEGIPITIRVWKNGESLHRGEDEKCSMPEGVLPDDLTVERALEILAKGTIGPRELGIDPETGLTIIVLTGRFGPFVQVGILEPGTKSKEKPKRASLFDGMDPETITFEEALELLSLPRTVGEIDGEEVTAQSGRYGPYLKKGTDSRTIGSEAQLLTITIEEAAAIYSQPKQARGRISKPPLAALGAHPETGAPIVVKDGRFGPYITDGATNATLPRGIDPAEVTLETAVQLLAERAARVDSNPKRTIKKKAVKKKAVKKKAVKKAVKKKAVKKAVKKKAVKKAAPKLDGGS
ncbi:MAG: type I DNA topoisomerase [Acidimicrobiia bacterium]|nr:type I DNA topoisomerase [Acidimicrobiia bacterium]